LPGGDETETHTVAIKLNASGKPRKPSGIRRSKIGLVFKEPDSEFPFHIEKKNANSAGVIGSSKRRSICCTAIFIHRTFVSKSRISN